MTEVNIVDKMSILDIGTHGSSSPLVFEQTFISSPCLSLALSLSCTHCHNEMNCWRETWEMSGCSLSLHSTPANATAKRMGYRTKKQAPNDLGLSIPRAKVHRFDVGHLRALADLPHTATCGDLRPLAATNLGNHLRPLEWLRVAACGRCSLASRPLFRQVSQQHCLSFQHTNLVNKVWCGKGPLAWHELSAQKLRQFTHRVQCKNCSSCHRNSQAPFSWHLQKTRWDASVAIFNDNPYERACVTVGLDFHTPASTKRRTMFCGSCWRPQACGSFPSWPALSVVPFGLRQLSPRKAQCQMLCDNHIPLSRA